MVPKITVHVCLVWNIVCCPSCVLSKAKVLGACTVSLLYAKAENEMLVVGALIRFLINAVIQEWITSLFKLGVPSDHKAMVDRGDPREFSLQQY